MQQIGNWARKTELPHAKNTQEITPPTLVKGLHSKGGIFITPLGGGCRSRVTVKFMNNYCTPLDAEKDIGSANAESAHLSDVFETMDIQDEPVRST